MKIRQFKISTKRVQINYMSGSLFSLKVVAFLFAFMCLICLNRGAVGQTEPNLLASAVAAYEQGDYKNLLSFTEQLYIQKPNGANVLRLHAAALAFNGKKRKSLQILKEWVYKDATVPFANHPDFESLTSMSGFVELVNIQQALSRPVVYDEVFVRVSINSASKWQGLYILNDSTVLVGEKDKRKIWAVSKNGNLKEWLDVPFSPLFIKKHPFTNDFWLATAALPETSTYQPHERGISNVLKVSAEKKLILQGVEFKEQNIITHLEIDLKNRLWTSQGATAYLTRNVTDTALYYGAFARNYFDLRDSHQSIRGMAISDDQKTLYFIDGKEGIFRIDIQTLNIEKLFAPDDVVLTGMDEIFYYKNTLIVIHNKSRPYRVMQYFLNNTGATLLFGNAINSGGKDLNKPVSGQFYKGYFYYIANSVSQNETTNITRDLIIRRMKL